MRISSLFEPKNLHIGASLLEHSHISEDLSRIAFLLRKTHEKVRLKHTIYPKRNAKQ